MPRTWRELREETSPQSWRRVRNLRAAPPSMIQAALRGHGREEVFHTGLEQAEQLFRAAAKVGRESRPLLLFYGLGQAGRALAAASDRLGDEDRAWAGSGHGLKIALGAVEPSNLWAATVRVEPRPRDLFSRASIALHSSHEIGTVTLGSLAANLGEFIAEFPGFLPHQQLLYLEKASANQLKQAVDDMLNYGVRVPDGVDVETFISHFPLLAAFPVLRAPDGRPAVDHNGLHLIQVPIDAFESQGTYLVLKNRQTYRASEVAVSAIGSSTMPVQPLMVWWILLYGLSMLARYEPSKWHDVLDIRSSSIWSQVEYLEDRALDAVPQLLAEALETLGGSASESRGGYATYA